MASRSPTEIALINNSTSSAVVSALAIAAKVYAGGGDKNASAIGALQKSFQDTIKNPKDLDEAVNYLYQSLLEDAVVSVFLEIHNLCKTGNLMALDGAPEDGPDTSFRIVDLPNYDIFGLSTAEKPMGCTCPNCDRPVAASRFAPHLEKCMGMGRTSSRKASRRLATKEGSTGGSLSSSYVQTNIGTDDEDDVDWSSEKRRKKNTQNSRNNGSKKNNGKSF